MADTTYEYQPLSTVTSTRVLQLEPHHDLKEPLRCSLKEIQLVPMEGEVVEPYEALSYVWGSPTGTLPLRCNSGVILITPNCDLALRYIRQATQAVRLWVDAICVNQGDVEERQRQVAIMGMIYTSAEEVLVWLGDGEGMDFSFISIARSCRRWSRYYLLDQLFSTIIDPFRGQLSRLVG